MYPYGQMFVGHALAAASAFGSYMLLAPPDGRDGRQSGRTALRTFDGRLLGAGFLAGWTVMFEYQAAFVAVALAGYAFYRYRSRALAFVTGALPVALALGTYHTALFGRPWRFPFGNVENAEFLRTAHSQGFHGLSLPNFQAIGKFLFSPDYGLFIFSPVLALGALLAFLAVARGPRRDGVLVLAVAALMFLFLAGMSNWRGGWCVGPRYITTVAPFLVLPIALSWPETRERPWLSALVAGLVFPSVLLNVTSGAVYPHYPEVFDNPLFDLTFPLLGEGYAPNGLGWLLGLHGLAALAPLAAVVLAAVALGAGGDDVRPSRWLAHVAAALVVAAAFLVPLSAFGRKPRAAEQGAANFVRATWEPQPQRPKP
jgi:hypothetical protein